MSVPEPVQPRLSHEQTLRLAWVILLSSFGLACLLLCTIGYMLWDYRINAMSSHNATLILRSPAEWVKVQRKGHTIFEQARNQQELDEGYRVSIARTAGYGQSTTVRLFEQSTIDMWAGADLLLETLQTSRWNNHLRHIELRQYHGYIRYDLQQHSPYETNVYRVLAGPIRAELAPGGSYSIEIKPSDRRIELSEDIAYEPEDIDIAVRSGYAVVYGNKKTVTVVAGQHVLVNPLGEIAETEPARWDLIRDGTFDQYSEEEYNNTTIPEQVALVRSQTWQVFSGAAEQGASGGFFKISQGCPPPFNETSCAFNEHIKMARFIRYTDQTTNFTTGVIQKLGPEREGADISEYRSLHFSIWVRIVHQSVKLTGERGTECPIMIRFVTKEKSPTDPEDERVICIYSSENPSMQPELAPGIRYYRTNLQEWFHLNIELRDPDWLPEARYMRSIEIFANGHNYDSRATMASLIGVHD